MEKPVALWRRLTIFRRKGHTGVNMSVILYFDTPSVEGGVHLCWNNNAELNKGGGLRIREKRPSNRRFPRRRIEDTQFFHVRR